MFSVSGLKALNKTSFQASSIGNSISFVSVFTIYNTSLDVHVDSRASNMVTVGNASYSKTERSMAILNVFINFIQASLRQIHQKLGLSSCFLSQKKKTKTKSENNIHWFYMVIQILTLSFTIFSIYCCNFGMTHLKLKSDLYVGLFWNSYH